MLRWISLWVYVSPLINHNVFIFKVPQDEKSVWWWNKTKNSSEKRKKIFPGPIQPSSQGTVCDLYHYNTGCFGKIKKIRGGHLTQVEGKVSFVIQHVLFFSGPEPMFYLQAYSLPDPRLCRCVSHCSSFVAVSESQSNTEGKKKVRIFTEAHAFQSPVSLPSDNTVLWDKASAVLCSESDLTGDGFNRDG